MLENQMLVGLAAMDRRQHLRDRRADQAHEMLTGEFLDGLADPLAPISTPGYEVHEQLPLADVVLDILCCEPDQAALAGLLQAAAASDDPKVLAALLTLAQRHADRHTMLLAEQGAFSE